MKEIPTQIIEPVNTSKAETVRLSDAERASSTSRTGYQGVIFGTSYFALEHPAGELELLASYLQEHDVKVGIVTTDKKAEYTKWLKKAPVKVDRIIGGGDVKAERYKFYKKPDPQPFEVCTARLGLYTEEVLSVCVRDVDLVGSRSAGIDRLYRPTPKQVIALLSKEPAPETMPERDLKGPVPATGIMGAICGDVIGCP